MNEVRATECTPSWQGNSEAIAFRMSQISPFHNPSRRIGGSAKRLRQLVAVRKSAAIRALFASEQMQY